MAESVEYKLLLNDDDFVKGMSAAIKKADELDGKTEKTNSSFKTLGRTIAGLGIGVAVGSAVKSVVNLGVEMEQTRVSFSTFLGDTEKANKVIGELNEFSNVTPFDNQSVIQAGKGLLAFGVQSENLIPSLKAIGDISAGTGKDFNELATIYGKAKVAGTLYAEDINQLVEAGVPIMGEFAKALGTTEANVKKMASEGKLKFSDLEKSFQNLTGEGGMFFNLMEKQSQTVGGRISTLVGKLQTIGIAIGEAILPTIGAFTDFALALVENTRLLKTIGMIVGIGAVAWGVYKVAVALSTLSTFSFSGAMATLNAVMLANPIGLVVAALGLLVAGFVVAWNHSETFRASLFGMWEVMKQIGQNIFKLLIEPLKAYAEIWQGIVDLFSGKGFSTLINGFKRLGSSLLTFLVQPLLQLVKGIDSLTGTNFAESFKKFTNVGDISEGTGDAFAKGFKDGVADFNKDQEKEEKKKAQTGTLSGLGATTQQATQGTGTGTKGGAKGGLAGVQGTKAVNLNINIEKLVENFEIATTNIESGASSIKDKVTRLLLEAVNDVNTIGGV